MFMDMVADSLFGYSFVNGYKKDRKLSKSGVETSGHLVKIIGKVINTQYSLVQFMKTGFNNQNVHISGFQN